MKLKHSTDPSANKNTRYGIRIAALAAAALTACTSTASKNSAPVTSPVPSVATITPEYPHLDKFTEQERLLEARLELAASFTAKSLVDVMQNPKSHVVVDTAYNRKERSSGLYSINNFSKTIASSGLEKTLPELQIYYRKGFDNSESRLTIEAQDLQTYQVGVEYAVAGATAKKLNDAVDKGQSPSISDFETAIAGKDVILSQVVASDPKTRKFDAPYIGFNDGGSIYLSTDTGLHNLPKTQETPFMDATIQNMYYQTAHVASLVG